MGSDSSKVIDCLVIADDTRDAKGKKSGFGWMAGAKLRLGETLLVREIGPRLLEFSTAHGGKQGRCSDLAPVAKLMADKGKRLREVQIWSHGGIAQPYIGATPLAAADFQCLRDVLEEGRGVIWFRCCNVAKDREGRKFLKAVAEESGARFVAGHEAVIGPLQPQLTFYDASTGSYHGPRDGAWANMYAHLHDIFSFVRE